MSDCPHRHPLIDDITPLDHPLGDSHHTDMPFTAADDILAHKLAWYMGTMQDHFRTPADLWQWWNHERTSHQEWMRAARALRIHGLKIVTASPATAPASAP